MTCPVFPYKRAFETEALADAAGADLALKVGRKIRSYACDFCHAWHLTKRKRKTRHRLKDKTLRRLLDRGIFENKSSMKPFFVIQCFDSGGYFTSLRGDSSDAVREEAKKRVNKNYVAMSLPFEGKWSAGHLPDVSLPPDFKEALAPVDKSRDD